MSDISFDNTSIKSEITLWYAVNGAPVIEDGTVKGRRLLPLSVKFIFADGDPYSVSVNCNILKNNGEASGRTMNAPGIYMWEQSKWPEWLRELHKLALSDFVSHLRKSAA